MNALAQLDAPLRPETLPPANALVHVSYAVQVEAEPDSLCRILNLFALQSLMPHAVQATQLDDLLAVRIELGGVSWARAELIALKMRNLICVAQVSLQGPGKIL